MATVHDASQTTADAHGMPDAEGGSAQTLPPSGRPSRGRRSANRPRRGGWGPRLELVVLIGPALLVFVAFVIFPVAMAAYYGFFSWSGYGPAVDFVGIRNYIVILTDPAFHEALGHNVFIAAIVDAVNAAAAKS